MEEATALSISVNWATTTGVVTNDGSNKSIFVDDLVSDPFTFLIFTVRFRCDRMPDLLAGILNLSRSRRLRCRQPDPPRTATSQE